MMLAALVMPGPMLAPAPLSPAADASDTASLSSRGWRWPVDAFRLTRPFEAPAHEYGPGHRGIDLAPEGSQTIRAPADGLIAFAGPVAGRGVLTIDHGDGLVTTLEPVTATVTAGSEVERGEAVAALAEGGHTASGMLHFGVRLHGDYINPLLLLGGVPRAVLLPCC
jgi:murein DD-endopeptidase MepM/ murein hydrolase activator NlpD